VSQVERSERVPWSWVCAKGGVRLRTFFRGSNLWGYVFSAPWIASFLVFGAYAMGFGVYLAFHKWDILAPSKPFVGLSNFQWILLKDTQYIQSFFNVLRYVVVVVPGLMLASLTAAILLNEPLKLRGFFRVMYYLPCVSLGIAVQVLFAWLFSTQGLINWVLSVVGIRGPAWWYEPFWAMPAISLMGIWGGFGFWTLVLLAGLQGIPPEFYEVAQIDGANWWQRHRHITIPLLNPTLLMQTIFITVGALQMFSQPFIMTGGGPMGSTRTPVLLLYWEGFTYMNMGRASAIGIVLAIVILAIVLLQRRLIERTIDY